MGNRAIFNYHLSSISLKADEMNRTAVQDKIEIELLDKLAGQENVIEELIAENSKLMIELYRHRNKSLR